MPPKDNGTVRFSPPGNFLKQVQFGGNFVQEVLLPALVILVVILAGAGTGWVLSKRKTGGVSKDGVTAAPGAKIGEGGKEVGIAQKNFRDTAEGVLEQGGIDGEGSHHLVREGGESQNVYLTSSVVDLGQFVGKKVQVWGETFAAEKAGWLMDVGRVKVLE